MLTLICQILHNTSVLLYHIEIVCTVSWFYCIFSRQINLDPVSVCCHGLNRRQVCQESSGRPSQYQSPWQPGEEVVNFIQHFLHSTKPSGQPIWSSQLARWVFWGYSVQTQLPNLMWESWYFLGGLRVTDRPIRLMPSVCPLSVCLSTFWFPDSNSNTLPSVNRVVGHRLG